MTSKPDDAIGWQRASGVASLWVTLTTVLLCGAIVLVDLWGSRDRTNPIPFWCYVGLFPVFLLTFLATPSLSGRVHRSTRVEELVGIFSLIGILLVLLCWTSPFLGVIRFGP